MGVHSLARGGAERQDPVVRAASSARGRPHSPQPGRPVAAGPRDGIHSLCVLIGQDTLGEEDRSPSHLPLIYLLCFHFLHL